MEKLLKWAAVGLCTTAFTIGGSAATLTVTPSDTFTITSRPTSGIFDQYLADDRQTLANQIVVVPVTVTASAGTVSYTVSVIPSQNYPVGLVTVPAGTLTALAPGSTGYPSSFNVSVSGVQAAALPYGIYSATIQVTPADGSAAPAPIPFTLTVAGGCGLCNVPSPIVFGGSRTPQQTGLTVVNPLGSTGPFNFTAGYVANNVYGSPLPAQNVFFISTGGTLISANGGFTTGSIFPGGLAVVPIEIDPAKPSPGYPNGLVTGLYSGELVASNNGQASGAAPPATVPILVYAGPGMNPPLNYGLGLILPTNSPFQTGGIGGCPTSLPPPPAPRVPNPCPPPGTSTSPGSYPISINVPSGYTPDRLPPTLISVTGLNNAATAPYRIKPPVTGGFPAGFPAAAVQIFDPDGSAPDPCNTSGTQTALPNSPAGAICTWQIVVDSSRLNTTSGGTPCPDNASITCFTGNLTFAPTSTSIPFLPSVVPLTIRVSSLPQLNVTQPLIFPNFLPQPNFCDSSSLACPQLLVGIPLPAAGIVLQSTPLNSTLACAEIGINASGGGWTPDKGIPNVTIAPFPEPWLSAQISTAPYLGRIPAYSTFPPPGSPTSGTVGWGFDGGFGLEGGPAATGAAIPIPLYYPSLATTIGVPVGAADWATCMPAGPGTPAPPCSALNTVAPFPAGPATVNNAIETLQLCANAALPGSATGTFTTTVTVSGSGAAAVTIPVTLNVVSNPCACSLPATEAGVFRDSGISLAPGGPNLGLFAESDQTDTFNASTKFRSFGFASDIPVAGDWLGSGITEIGTFRCPPVGQGQCQWYIDANNNGKWDGLSSPAGGDQLWFFGLPGDIPVVGDWTGDGKAKIGVVRCPPASAPGLCTWYLDVGNEHAYDPATVGTFVYGVTGDKPAVGGWAGHFPSDQIGVFRCPTGPGVCQWTVESLGMTGHSTTVPASVYSPADAVFNFGLAGDQPVIGNWNGNGTKRIGVFRASTGQWFVDTNGNGVFDPAADQMFNFGLPNDKAVAGFFAN